jgi:hypothetical protein
MKILSKSLWWFCPLLLSIYPVLSLWSTNPDQVNSSQIFLPLLSNLLLSTLMFGAAGLLLRNLTTTSVFLSLVLFLAVGLGHFLESKTVIPVLAGFIVILFAVFYRTRTKNQEKLLSLLSVISFAICASSLLSGVRNFKATDVSFERDQQAERYSVKKATDDPNIIFIIPDGYAGDTTLREVYKYDNSDFRGFLEKKGFSLPESQSNYLMTLLSLGSALTMDYVKVPEEFIEKKTRAPMFTTIDRASALDYLRARGYKIINISSGWGPTDYLDSADINFVCGQYDEFFIKAAPLSPLVFVKKWLPLLNPKGSISACALKKAAEIPKKYGERIDGKPYFVFVHVISPHAPYFLDKNCNSIVTSELKFDGDAWDQKDLYLGQLECTNKLLKDIVTSWTAPSTIPSAIVILSDHGSAVGGADITTPGEAQDFYLRQRFDNFAAFRFPKAEEIKSLTPVNVFPILYNHLFGEKFPLKPKKLYFSTYERPYKFQDLTNEYSRPKQ